MTRGLLGFKDLVFYAASVSLSIRWISVAAAAGPAALPIWLVAVVVFSGPLIIATAELTTRVPGEGGVYAWTGQRFGPFWGFLCGWLYWMSNLPFFSSLLMFMVNLLALGLGPSGQPLLAHPLLFAAVAVSIAMLIGAAHRLGLGAGKWLSTLGAASSFALVALLIALALLSAARHGSATDFARADYRPPWTADGAILWATMVFGVGGTEALAFLRNDVRGGMKTILRVLALAAMMQLIFYLSGTSALLVLLTPQSATRLSGLPDALIIGLDHIGLHAFAPAVLIGAFLCTLGAFCAWFGVAARLPFAAGLDAVLPAVFGRRDPRTGAPSAAIWAQTALVVGLVALSQTGNNLKGAYDFLVAMSVLSYTLPFVFLFLVFLTTPSDPAPTGAWIMPGGRVAARAVGWVGLVATLSAVACTLVPTPGSPEPGREVARLVSASAVLILSGVGFYAVRRRRPLAVGRT